MGLDRASFNQGKEAKYSFLITQDGTFPTIVAKGPGAVLAIQEELNHIVLMDQGGRDGCGR